MPAALLAKGTLSLADDARLDGMDLPDKPPAESSPEDNLTDEERRKKIAALRQAVADGSYHVSAEQLADKLIDHMLEPKG
jgi:anti-sigma28 factor (negative regulator of flagellin synthesis)